MKKKIFTTAAIILTIASCTTTQHLQPADADLVIAQQRIPGITLADMQAGYKIYSTNCSGCHRLYAPKEFTAVKWKPILTEMFAKAKMTDEKQKELVSNYIIAKSK